MSPLSLSLQNQKFYFQAGKTLDLRLRQEQLKKMERVLIANENRLLNSLHLDLKKSKTEAWSSELAVILKELRFAQSKLRSWARPRRVAISPFLQPGRGYVHAEPYGQVLIMAPWNYPLHLLLLPAVGALAAGNVLTLKPSELAPHTSKIIREIIQENFPSEYILVLEGDLDFSQKLLQHPFDYIFFTGSSRVGKMVMSAAAHHLTPVTLELGGKSPCIVDATANLKVAARRIAWGKFYNAGQTCIAPDYLLIHKDVRRPFLHLLADSIEEFYTVRPKESPDYGRIINKSHLDRLLGFLKDGEVLLGGEFDRESNYLAPTIIINPDRNSPLMREEIFGPILPCLDFSHIQEALELIQTCPKPLALYLFSRDVSLQRKIISQVQFGGGCINDCLVQAPSPSLPFGGIGPSGIGQYHGKYTFETFSHLKSLVKKSTWLDFSLRYPPYKDKLKWFRFLQ